jgi:cyclic di-GMP phosphodiesterase
MANPETATILVVDDERGPRESLRMILAPGYEVLVAGSSSEALDVLRRCSVDVVTVDLNMPGISGQELMRAIHEQFPHVEVIVITGCGSLDSAAQGIRFGICDYLTKPFDVVQVSAAVARALARRRARTGLVAFLEQLGSVVGRDREANAILDELERCQKLRGRIGDLLGEAGDLASSAPRPPRTIEFLEVLAETIETKDRFMRGHARRVAFFSGLVAERLHLSVEERQQVRLAAFLHDLGKVGVPTDLLLRAGALGAAERSLVERHPEIGARLLVPLDIPHAISQAVHHHHEWWDGSGYPDGLAGEEIPLAARIIGVTDAFDAMSCDRPYRRALRRDIVMGELKRYAGVQFDPVIAKELLAVLEAGGEDVDLMLLAETAAGVETTRVSA